MTVSELRKYLEMTEIVYGDIDVQIMGAPNIGHCSYVAIDEVYVGIDELGANSKAVRIGW